MGWGLRTEAGDPGGPSPQNHGVTTEGLTEGPGSGPAAPVEVEAGPEGHQGAWS